MNLMRVHTKWVYEMSQKSRVPPRYFFPHKYKTRFCECWFYGVSRLDSAGKMSRGKCRSVRIPHISCMRAFLCVFVLLKRQHWKSTRNGFWNELAQVACCGALV